MLVYVLILAIGATQAFKVAGLPRRGSEVGDHKAYSADQACHDMLVKSGDRNINVEACNAKRIDEHRASFYCRDTKNTAKSFHGHLYAGEWKFTCPKDKPYVHVGAAASVDNSLLELTKAKCHSFRWPE